MTDLNLKERDLNTDTISIKMIYICVIYLNLSDGANKAIFLLMHILVRVYILT